MCWKVGLFKQCGQTLIEEVSNLVLRTLSFYLSCLFHGIFKKQMLQDELDPWTEEIDSDAHLTSEVGLSTDDVRVI